MLTPKMPEPHCPHRHGKLETTIFNPNSLPSFNTLVYKCSTCNEIASYTLLQRAYLEGYQRGESDRAAIVTERDELNAEISELEARVKELENRLEEP